MRQDFFNTFPIFDLGDHIILREINLLNDIENFYYYIKHPEVEKLVLDVPSNLDAAKRELAYWRGMYYSRQTFFWAVVDSRSDRMIGTAGFNFLNFTHAKTEISYELSYQYWGQGIATKIARKFVELTFNYFKLNRIAGIVEIENPASMKVLEKAGFKYEGYMKEYVKIRNEYTDSKMFGMTKKDYLELVEKGIYQYDNQE